MMSIFWGLPDSDRFGGRKCVVILYPPGGRGGRSCVCSGYCLVSGSGAVLKPELAFESGWKRAGAARKTRIRAVGLEC